MLRKAAQSDFAIPPEAEGAAAKLSDVELAFANLILNGMTQAEAYRKTHRGCSKSAAWVGGSRLARTEKVRNYIEAVREVLWRENIVGLRETLSRLGEVIRDQSTPLKELLAAMALNAKLGGFDRPAEEPEEEDDSEALDAWARRLLPTLDIPEAVSWAPEVNPKPEM